MTKTKTVSIIDYGVGNLLSVERAFSACRANVKVIRTPEEIKFTDRLVLPGVGAFGKCIDELRLGGFEDPIKDHIQAQKPLLGICVGMQILHEIGEEFGQHAGLGIIPGKVSKIPQTHSKGTHKIPFIGWAEIIPTTNKMWDEPILKGIMPGNSFYFVHSFMAIPRSIEHSFAYYHYNDIKITAIVSKENVYGCQFHPEKSGQVGLTLLNNFLSI